MDDSQSDLYRPGNAIPEGAASKDTNRENYVGSITDCWAVTPQNERRRDRSLARLPLLLPGKIIFFVCVETVRKRKTRKTKWQITQVHCKRVAVVATKTGPCNWTQKRRRRRGNRFLRGCHGEVISNPL